MGQCASRKLGNSRSARLRSFRRKRDPEDDERISPLGSDAISRTKELYLTGIKSGTASLKLKDKLALAQALTGGREGGSVRPAHDRSVRAHRHQQVSLQSTTNTNSETAASVVCVSPTRPESISSLLLVYSRAGSTAAKDHTRVRDNSYSRAISSPSAEPQSLTCEGLRRINSLGPPANDGECCGDSCRRGPENTSNAGSMTKMLHLATGLSSPGRVCSLVATRAATPPQLKCASAHAAPAALLNGSPSAYFPARQAGAQEPALYAASTASDGANRAGSIALRSIPQSLRLSIDASVSTEGRGPPEDTSWLNPSRATTPLLRPSTSAPQSPQQLVQQLPDQQGEQSPPPQQQPQPWLPRCAPQTPSAWLQPCPELSPDLTVALTPRFDAQATCEDCDACGLRSQVSRASATAATCPATSGTPPAVFAGTAPAAASTTARRYLPKWSDQKRPSINLDAIPKRSVLKGPAGTGQGATQPPKSPSLDVPASFAIGSARIDASASAGDGPGPLGDKDYVCWAVAAAEQPLSAEQHQPQLPVERAHLLGGLTGPARTASFGNRAGAAEDRTLDLVTPFRAELQLRSQLDRQLQPLSPCPGVGAGGSIQLRVEVPESVFSTPEVSPVPLVARSPGQPSQSSQNAGHGFGRPSFTDSRRSPRQLAPQLRLHSPISLSEGPSPHTNTTEGVAWVSPRLSGGARLIVSLPAGPPTDGCASGGCAAGPAPVQAGWPALSSHQRFGTVLEAEPSGIPGGVPTALQGA